MDHLNGVGCDPIRYIDRMSGMHSSNISVFRHVTSFVSFAFVTANLLFWLPILLLATVIRIVVPFGYVKNATYRVVEFIYRSAVKIDAWWFSKILGIEFEIEDPTDVLGSLSNSQSPVIISNHQSWFDIFLLQTLISSRGPILKFVIKVELLWVPVLGWICLVLDFPRLSRKMDAKSRSKDRRRVQSATITLGKEPGGLLIFPEGTRFNQEKRAARGSPYRHLLTPKAGGLSVIQQSIPLVSRILDVSIRYDPGDADCWRCMSGLVDNIQVKVESFELRDVADPAAWLNGRWSAKDAWLAIPSHCFEDK